MKKLISILLSLILTLAIFTPVYTIVSDKIERDSVISFCSAVTDLTARYDNGNYSAICDEDGNKSFSEFVNRLIVKTDDKIDNTDAVECIYGLDYAVLQYENQGSMLREYEKLTELGYKVEKDRVLTVFDAEQSALEEQNNVDVNALNTYTEDSQEEIVVGIMDTGINYNHTEFRDRYVHNPVNFSGSGSSDDPMDDQMHGTACASIVTQNTPENVKVKPYKILDKNGMCTGLNEIAACEYILAEKDKPDVINMSFGGYSHDENSDIVRELIEQLVQNGIVISAAAGNEKVPSDFCFPANCKSVITVASCNYKNEFSSFSNYGNLIDVTAPGENIRTAALNGGYSSELSGTSFSAPHVSASCALVLLKKPDATPSEIKELIKSTAIDMGEEDQFYYGAGVLSFNNLLDEFNVETPEPNVAGGKYHEAQTIDFGNDYQGTLVYTTDRTTPTSKNGIEYTGPITIDCDTQLTYALMVGNTYISPIKTANYIIQYYAPASDFTAVAGTIMKYKGDKTNIIVPDKISGLKPTALYKELFKNSNLTGIVLPDTVTTLGTGCFQDSEKLRHIVAPGVTKLNGDYVFSGCKDLRDEVMPKLRTVTTGAFKYCSRLHKIDFGASITEFKNELFYGSGLMYGDFPNAKDSEASEVFRSCPLFTCSIPKFTNLYTKFFYNCAMLHELQIGQVTKIYDSALYSCIFLKQLDVSNITQLDQNALSGCCVDTFCAPNCTQLPSKLGKYCNIRVIDLPNAQGSLGTDFLNTSMTEELYMEQATSMQKHSLRNTVDLNIIYLPNVLQYYEPYTNVEKIDSLLTNDYYEQKAPLEIIWVPVAQLPETIDCYATRLIYAPSAESIHIAVHSDTVMPNVVVSDKITADNITITNSGNGAVVISKENSYAQQYSLNENCGYTFVSTDDVTYENTDERSYFTYSTESSYFSVPKRFIVPYWQEDVINISRNELFYGFLLDFADDDVINAKDYSILVRNDM